MSLEHQRFSIAGIREHEETHRPASRLNIGELERWTSAIGGTLLVTQGLRRPSVGNLALSLLGAGLIYRGVTGHCSAYEALHIDTAGKHRTDDASHIHQGVTTRHSVTINRSPSELYSFWHEVENGTKFMVGIDSIKDLGDNKSHWVAGAAFGAEVEWDSVVIVDKLDRLIAWKSLPGSELDQAGSVRFEPASGGRGTVVTLEQNIGAPGGIVGRAFARLFSNGPEFQVRESLRHFKQLMETGEIPTIQGQSSGRPSNRQIATPLPQSV